MQDLSNQLCQAAIQSDNFRHSPTDTSWHADAFRFGDFMQPRRYLRAAEVEGNFSSFVNFGLKLCFAMDEQRFRARLQTTPNAVGSSQ